MVDFGPFLTPAIILTIAGLSITIIFQIFKEKRERKEERRKQIERDESQRQAFAKQVAETVEKEANDLKEKLDLKLEVIRETTTGLKSNLEEFKTVNRDEILSIKREIERLKEEADHLNKQVQENKLNKVEVENRISQIIGQIEGLKQRVETMEVRISNHEGMSSTR